jgi:hypothetical protein
MCDEEVAFMRRVGLDVGDVRRRECVDQALAMPAGVPFAANPTDLGEAAILGERFEDRLLAALAVELQGMSVVDAELDEPVPEVFCGDCWDVDAEVAVARVKIVPQLEDIFADAAVRDGGGQEALAIPCCDRNVRVQQLRVDDLRVPRTSGRDPTKH